MWNRCYGCMQLLSYPDEKCPYCGYDSRAKLFDRNHLPPGTVIGGRYVLGAALGLGGFGNTYIGWDPQTEMRVTVREYLPSTLAYHRADTVQVQWYSAQGRALFQKGMRQFCSASEALRKMPETECINPILDIVRDNDTAYTVMQYLSGQTLKAYLSEYRSMSFEDAMEIMAPVLRTLETVHQHDLLHRDVSPDNIFLCEDGQVRILDFGLAQYDLTPENGERLSVMFKPGFAPPEQYMPHLLPGPWTDVYGAGATLYKMITGMAPPDVPQRQREETLLPPHELDCDIPADAEYALLRSLSLPPENRYATAQAFLSALQGEGDEEASRRVDVQKVLIPVLGVIAALIVIVGVYAVIARRVRNLPAPVLSSQTELTSQPQDGTQDMADVTFFDTFTPQAMEVVRTQTGDAACVPYAVFVQNGKRGLAAADGTTVLPANYKTVVWDTAAQCFLLDGKTWWEAGTGIASPAEPAARDGGDLRTSVYTYDPAGHVLYRAAGGERYAQTASEGSFLVGTGPYGVVTRGTLLVEPSYEKATPICCGIAAFLHDGQWTYLNTFGVDVFGRSFDASVFPDGVPFSYSNGFVPYYDEDSGLWGYADTAGAVCVPAQFLSALPPVQYAAWVQTEDGRFGVISLRASDAKDGALCGKCGENIQYTYTPQTGLLEIEGYGSFWDFTAQTVPWAAVCRQIRTVRIAGDIDYIGAGSFNGCTALTGVTVTGALRAVGPFAFAGCGNLRMVTLSDTVETVGDLAFADCAALADLPLSGVRNCGVYAFSGSGLTQIALREQAFAGRGCFAGCTALQSADLSGVQDLGSDAFAGCTALQSVTMPSRMASIGARAFADCTALELIRVPPGVAQVEEQTFLHCSALRTVTLPDGMRSIGQQAFSGCAVLGAVSLPPTLTTIGTRAFEQCAGLRNVMVPNSVTNIGAYAFAGCTGVTAFELKDSVQTLGAHVFDGWTSGQTIRIKNVLLKRLLGNPPGWDAQWDAGCRAQIVSA